MTGRIIRIEHQDGTACQKKIRKWAPVRRVLAGMLKAWEPARVRLSSRPQLP